MIEQTKRHHAGRPLTRSQVAKQLGVSIATVRRMEGKELHPQTRSADRVRLFDANEVAAVGTKRAKTKTPVASEEGELAAELFKRFSEKQNHHQIVIEMKLPPHVVRKVYAEWMTCLEQGLADAEFARDQAIKEAEQKRRIAFEKHKRRNLDSRRRQLENERTEFERAMRVVGEP